MVQGSLSGPGPLPGAGRRPLGWAGERRDRGGAGPLAWRALWAPFWLWSDVPAPALPGREPAPPAQVGLAGEVVLRGLDDVRRRLWLRHALSMLVRAAWLGLAVGCLWLAVELAGGPALDVRRLAWVAAGFGLLGVAGAAVARPTRTQTARMMDRSFGLQERMATALDHLGRGVPREGQRAPVTYLQMADAANVVIELRRDRALGVRVPVRELVLAVFFGLLMAALAFVRGVGGDIPPVAAGAVPAFTPAVERPPEPDPAEAAADAPAELPPTVEEVQERSERSNLARQDLQELARALQDHAVTRPAAEAIGQGEYEEAANELRDLAPSADRLSPGAREELARDLEHAASSMSPDGNELGQSAQDAASGLRQGEQAAQEGVRALGEAVEQTGDRVASQQALAEEMRRAEAAEAQGQRQGQGQQDQQGQQGQQSQGQPGEAQPGQQGAPGEGQPGDGAPQPGQAGQEGAPQPGEGGQPGEGQPGEGPPGEGQQGGQPGQPGGQPGDGEQGGQAGSEGQAGEGGGEASGEGRQSSRGGGAGAGESEQAPGDDAAGAAGEGEGEAEGAAGVPAEEQVSEGSGEGVAAGEPDPVTETIQLPPGAADGEGVQTSNDGGGSRQGTGAGVTAGAGTSVQGEVGEAGPDSNRVPPAYRSTVERYFSADGDGDAAEGEE